VLAHLVEHLTFKIKEPGEDRSPIPGSYYYEWDVMKCLMAYMIGLEGALLPIACAGPQCQRASYSVTLRDMKLDSYRVGDMKWLVMRCWTDHRC
jgi:hypothetical protein